MFGGVPSEHGCHRDPQAGLLDARADAGELEARAAETGRERDVLRKGRARVDPQSGDQSEAETILLDPEREQARGRSIEAILTRLVSLCFGFAVDDAAHQ